MKTQINQFRSGAKFQILNPDIDYDKLPKATSHVGHGGTNRQIARQAWQNVILENPEMLNIKIKGVEFTLTADKNAAGEPSGAYYATISRDALITLFLMQPSAKKDPSIAIYGATDIQVSNGKNSHISICPSLVEIL